MGLRRHKTELDLKLFPPEEHLVVEDDALRTYAVFVLGGVCHLTGQCPEQPALTSQLPLSRAEVEMF